MIAEKRELFFSFLAKVNSASQTCGWPTNEDATLQVKRSAVVQHVQLPLADQFYREPDNRCGV